VVILVKLAGPKDAIFGEGGGQKISELFGEKLLVHIPLDSDIRLKTDAGQYFTESAAFHYHHLFAELALKVTSQMAAMPKDYSAVFPTIKIEG